MEVGTFEQNRSGINIPEFEIQPDRGDGVGQDLFLYHIEIKPLHEYEFYRLIQQKRPAVIRQAYYRL